jgi:hypothetical protein
MKKTIKIIIIIAILIIAFFLQIVTESGNNEAGKGAIKPTVAPKKNVYNMRV